MIVRGRGFRLVETRRTALVVVAAAWVTMSAALVSAGVGVAPTLAGATDTGFDDPKLTREMGAPRPLVRPPVAPAVAKASVRPASPTRPASVPSLAVAPAPALAVAPAPAPAPKVIASPSPLPRVPPALAHAPERAVPAVVPKRLALADARDGSVAPFADIAQTRKPPPDVAAPAAESATAAWPYAPRLKLGYRRFPFTRVVSAAPAITAGTLDPNRPESFESLSLDLYAISWYLRVGLSTQFGWESGQFNRTGDYFFAESGSVGFQLPGRFTPFVEAIAGAGYMRRKQVDFALPTAYWQTGIDAGVEIYFARRAYLSLAAGYLHPGNLYLMDQNLHSVKADTWSLKVGIGI